ncbi:MAG: carboxylating nicotinate-nucleotide diphosphorylase [Cellvibrionaceae bacterium]
MINETPNLNDYPTLKSDIIRSVHAALEEDIKDGDITAELIPAENTAQATIITREDCVVCGVAWVEEVFRQLGGNIEITWHAKDSDHLKANDKICTLKGNARILLTGERAALNFMQLLSGTATTSRDYAALAKGTNVKILDTRKTIPGLRTAQKYAVRCGGSYNHRVGLYDAFLIKENHIAACGGIANAIRDARKLHPGKKVEVEVENLKELEAALAAEPDIIMLDNFSAEDQIKAASIKTKNVKYEVSGNIDLHKLETQELAGVDYISSGAISKNLRAIDLSMRFI